MVRSKLAETRNAPSLQISLIRHVPLSGSLRNLAKILDDLQDSSVSPVHRCAAAHVQCVAKQGP